MSIVGLVCGATVAHAAVPGCTCDRDEVLDRIRAADTIFYGFVVDAHMESASSEHIRMTVGISDPIRGPKSGRISITTTMPGSCGVPALLGNHSLYVIDDPGKAVTRCNGSSLQNADDWLYLVFALVTVAYVEKDPLIVKDWLQRAFYEGSERQSMDDYFALIGEFDPSTIIRYTANEVIYRDLVFVFTDDKLVSYFWR